MAPQRQVQLRRKLFYDGCFKPQTVSCELTFQKIDCLDYQISTDFRLKAEAKHLELEQNIGEMTEIYLFLNWLRIEMQFQKC